MSKTNVIYREFLSFRQDGSIEIVDDISSQVLNLVISNNGNSIKIPYPYSLNDKDSDERLNVVKDLVRKANLLGRASKELKNTLKRRLYPELLALGEITEDEYHKYMGNLINDEEE